MLMPSTPESLLLKKSNCVMKFFILLFGLINLFAVSTRASSYKKKKKRVHVVVSAQQKRELALKDSLRTYFENYQLEGYYVKKASTSPVGINSLVHLMTLFL